LKYFTFLSRGKIEEITESFPADEDARYRQRILAHEVTELVHGADNTFRAERASALLFQEQITTLSADEVLTVFDDVPSAELALSEIGSEGIGIVDLLARVKLAPSKSEARRLVESGGVYVNNRRALDLHGRLRVEDAIGGQLFLLRKGQKQNFLVRLT
jgi:tyrosyl-tRNA synthetase